MKNRLQTLTLGLLHSPCMQSWVWLAARDVRRIGRNNSVLSYSMTRRGVTASQPQKFCIHLGVSSFYHNNASSTCWSPTMGQHTCLTPNSGGVIRIITPRQIIYMQATTMSHMQATTMSHIQDSNDALPTSDLNDGSLFDWIFQHLGFKYYWAPYPAIRRFIVVDKIMPAGSGQTCSRQHMSKTLKLL